MSDWVIIIQGPSIYTDRIKNLLSGYNIIFSTWIAEEKKYDKSDIVVLNAYPKYCGIANVFYQQTTTLNGLLKAKEMGYKNAIKIRSDMIIKNPKLFIECFTNKLNFLATHTSHNGYLIDYFMGGNIDYMIDLWSFPSDIHYPFPEYAITQQFIKMNLNKDEVSFILDKLNKDNDIDWIKYNIQISCYNNYPFYTTSFKDYSI